MKFTSFPLVLVSLVIFTCPFVADAGTIGTEIADCKNHLVPSRYDVPTIEVEFASHFSRAQIKRFIKREKISLDYLGTLDSPTSVEIAWKTDNEKKRQRVREDLQKKIGKGKTTFSYIWATGSDQIDTDNQEIILSGQVYFPSHYSDAWIRKLLRHYLSIDSEKSTLHRSPIEVWFATDVGAEECVAQALKKFPYVTFTNIFEGAVYADNNAMLNH